MDAVRILFSWALALGLADSVLAASPADVSCECPKLECNSCQEEQGLTFYSEKCGPDGSRVRSCARPTCVAQENPPPSCRDTKSNAAHAAKAEVREPASVTAPTASVVRGPKVGQISVLSGQAWLKKPDGSEELASLGMDVHQGDSLRTAKGGRVEVGFLDDNKMLVQGSSAARIQQYESSAEAKRAVIDLIRGKVRNQVKQKYNGETSYYRVRTKTAVAGVRGTDFITSYEEGDHLEMQVTTLEGKVWLANHDASQSLEVAAGESAAYVVAANTVFDQKEMSEFVARGYLTPVHKLTQEEIVRINRDHALSAGGRAIASESRPQICQEPKAEFNQCSWQCVNNPKGEKSCRTDLKDVSCVRKRCNANGDWAEESRMPASSYEMCKPSGFAVGPCNY